VGADIQDAATLHARRRIIELDTGEVSLVDHPAIRRKFLITKRAEGDVKITKAMTALGTNFDFVQIDVEKSIPGELLNSVKAVVPWLEKTAEAAQDPAKSAITATADLLSTMLAGQFPVPKAPEGEVPAAKTADAKPEEDEKKPSKPAKQKATKADDEDEKPVEGAADDKPAEGAADDKAGVQKGRKTFTNARTNSLKEMAEKALDLLAEADEDVYKAVILRGKELPNNPKFTPAITASDAKPIKKSEELDSVKQEISQAMDAKFSEVQKSLQGLGDKFEQLQKARSPSTSVDTSGGTDGQKPVTKSNFWGGLL
jgi:hypothetical protein